MKKLSAYDGKCVRICLKDGSVFEGACRYLDTEYSEAELGIGRESLLASAKAYGKSPYGEHLKAVAEGRVLY